MRVETFRVSASLSNSNIILGRNTLSLILKNPETGEFSIVERFGSKHFKPVCDICILPNEDFLVVEEESGDLVKFNAASEEKGRVKGCGRFKCRLV